MEPSLEDFVARDDLLYHGTLPSPAAPNDALARLDLAESDEQPATPSKAARLTPSSDAPPSPSPSPARQLTPIPFPELLRNHPRSSATITNGSSATSDCTHPAAVDDTTLAAILPLAHLTLPNPYPSLAPFLSSFSLPILSELLRPSWDTYFMLLASLASLRSNCMKRRVGAVLVREKRVVSTGYNGTPRGVRNCGEGGCGRCNSHGDGWGDDPEPSRGEGDVFSNGDNGGGGERRPAAANGARNLSRIGEALDECLCLHAEENALLEAGRQRVSGGGTEGAVLYCNTCVSSAPPFHSSQSPRRLTADSTPPLPAQLPLPAMHGQDCPVRRQGSHLLALVLDGRGVSASHGGSRGRPAADPATCIPAMIVRSTTTVLLHSAAEREPSHIHLYVEPWPSSPYNRCNSFASAQTSRKRLSGSWLSSSG